MAGDLPISESVVIAGTAGAAVFAAAEADQLPARVLHSYGKRVKIVSSLEQGDAAEAEAAGLYAADEIAPDDLDEIEALGLAAFQLRQSAEYKASKANRVMSGEPWNMEGGCMPTPEPGAESAEAEGAEAGPTSSFLESPVALGIIIVEGPTNDLQFSAAERTTVVAEVQNAMGWHASLNPWAGLSFAYDIRTVRINTAANPNLPDAAKEGAWRDPAMGALGYAANWSGVGQYVEAIRTSLRTRWTYVAYFTKYPVYHFAYAGAPRVVFDYNNDGWGPSQIDRVFAHESGHIFGCPDEYASSGCNCGGAWGRYGKPNLNCANCAPNGGVSCLMKANDWTLCQQTPMHFGWPTAPIFVKHSGKALDVTGASNASGAKIQQWDFWNGANQRFMLVGTGGGYYKIIVEQSGKVFDVEGISTANGAKVQQWDWWGGDNQQWRLEHLGDGYFRLIAKHSGKVLDIVGVSTASGAQLQQWDWNGGDNQRFRLYRPPAALFVKHTNKALDIAGISQDSGAKLQQWAFWNGPNQRFRLEPVDAVHYRIVCEHSGKVLDVEGQSTANGAKLQQWDWWGGDNQKFRFDPMGGGFYRIVAKHSGKCFDVTGISTADGAIIQQWDWWGGDNQKFRF